MYNNTNITNIISNNMSSKGKKGKSTKKVSTPEPENENETETTTSTVDYSKLSKDIRAVPISEWDWNRLVYSEPQKKEIPDGSGYYRSVRIQYMYDDKTIGPAIVELGKHYCFGVQPDNTDKDGKILKDKQTGKEKQLRGYRVPIVMSNQNKNSPTVSDEDQREIDFFDDWKAELVRYATENKKALAKGAVKDFDAITSAVLYRKKDDDGNVVEDIAPKLYGNLIYYSNKKEVGTSFYGPGDKSLNPLKMTGHFHIYPNIRFDSIYVAKGVSLQHRVYDATVEPIERASKKRLARPNSQAVGEDDEANGDTTAFEATDNNDMMESESEADEEASDE